MQKSTKVAKTSKIFLQAKPRKIVLQEYVLNFIFHFFPEPNVISIWPRLTFLGQIRDFLIP